jgi:hypothetical protein
LAGLLGGCATVTRGTTNQVTIESEPGGAEAIASAGYACPETPCIWDVGRKSEFIVTFKKSGYETMHVPVKTRIAGAGVAGFAGNVLIGGVVGMGVDAVTGSTLEHYPNPVVAEMVRSRSAGSSNSGPRRPAAQSRPRVGTGIDGMKPRTDPVS